MRKIFLIYWFWYVATLLLLIWGFNMAVWIRQIFAVNMFLSFVFIAFAPIYHLIYSKKSHRTDQRYLNACLNSGVIRAVIWVGAFYGINDHKTILALNAFGMLIFILMESKLKQIDKSYFNY